MKKYLVICVLLSSILLQGQDTVTYRFIDTYRLEHKTVDVFNGMQEFNQKRIFYKDSIFIEKERGLLYDNKPYKFKIKDGCWYIKKTGKWQLFYSPNNNITAQLKIYYDEKKTWWCNFKAVDAQTLFGYDCIIYEFEPVDKLSGFLIGNIGFVGVKSITLGRYVKYWFSPKLGIIKLETAFGSTIREDVIPRELVWW
jgi:hypothetical protein